MDAMHRRASVGEQVDRYFDYDMLVGEADGGVLLPEKEFRALQEKARACHANRLFVTWRNLESGLDCINCGPFTRCFCGHSYKVRISALSPLHRGHRV